MAVDLITGFEQAGTVVVKLENMDAGQFKEAIDYLVRNNIPYGNVKLINKRGNLLEITKKEIRVGAYKKKNKGIPVIGLPLFRHEGERIRARISRGGLKSPMQR